MMNNLQTKHNVIADWIFSHERELIRAAEFIFEHPELAYEEVLSSKYLADYLRNKGFLSLRKRLGSILPLLQNGEKGSPLSGFLQNMMRLRESDTPAGITCWELRCALLPVL